MTCEDVSRDEVIERYVLGQLADEAREAFELHYFECARCFGLLRTFRDLQAELARSREEIVAPPARSWIQQWAWLPAAAVVVLAASVVVVWQGRDTGIVAPPTTENGPAAPAGSPAPGPAPTAAAVAPSLEDLARVEAPPYVPARLRGSDAAAATFQEAMKRYQQHDYTAAIPKLREASALDPAAPHIAFFLGVSNLLAGRTDEAIVHLRASIALGDSPYLEEARFYLAKAYVRVGRVDDAISELERTIRLQGERQADARLLVDQLQVLKTTPR